MRDNHSGSDRSSDLEEKKNSPEFFDLRQVIRMLHPSRMKQKKNLAGSSTWRMRRPQVTQRISDDFLLQLRLR
jgi:hypothetical protein